MLPALKVLTKLHMYLSLDESESALIQRYHFGFKRFLFFKLLFGSIFLVVLATSVSAQDSTKQEVRQGLQFSGALDIFYAYDLGRPLTRKRQSFLYNHNRHNQVNLNHGYLKASIDGEKFRTNLALHAGTYVQDNYADEPEVLQYLFEANVGVALNANTSWWLDAGIMPSHLGFEIPTSMENATLTRSILAENSPYYLAGVKLSYTHAVWEAALLVLNGWQRIRPVKGNSLPAWGTQLTVRPADILMLNWSTFIGTDDPDETRRMRYFSNLYGVCTVSPELELTAGFDVGFQQLNKGSSTYAMWYSPVLIMKYQASPKSALALRCEYYSDSDEVIVNTSQHTGFKTFGFSVNLDYKPHSRVWIRTEARTFTSRRAIFEQAGVPSDKNQFMVSSIAYRF